MRRLRKCFWGGWVDDDDVLLLISDETFPISKRILNVRNIYIYSLYDMMMCYFEKSALARLWSLLPSLYDRRQMRNSVTRDTCASLLLQRWFIYFLNCALCITLVILYKRWKVVAKQQLARTHRTLLFLLYFYHRPLFIQRVTRARAASGQQRI